MLISSSVTNVVHQLIENDIRFYLIGNNLRVICEFMGNPGFVGNPYSIIVLAI